MFLVVILVLINQHQIIKMNGFRWIGTGPFFDLNQFVRYL